MQIFDYLRNIGNKKIFDIINSATHISGAAITYNNNEKITNGASAATSDKVKAGIA